MTVMPALWVLVSPKRFSHQRHDTQPLVYTRFPCTATCVCCTVDNTCALVDPLASFVFLFNRLFACCKAQPISPSSDTCLGVGSLSLIAAREQVTRYLDALLGQQHSYS